MKTQNSKLKTKNYNSKLKIIYFCLNFALCTLTLHFVPGSPLGTLLTFNFGTVNAEGISLSVSPSLLQIQLTPPAEEKAPLTLQNQGIEPINIQVLLKPFRPFGEAGDIEFINEQTAGTHKHIFSQVKLTDDGIVSTHFDLGPKQKKNLELHFTIPKNEKRADYYFSVIFLARASGLNANVALSEVGSTMATRLQTDQVSPETSPENQNFSTINAGIAANVLLSIGSTNPPQGVIEEFSAPTFLQSGPVEFTIRIKNTGPHLITPKGIIFIKNIFGQTIGRLDILPVNILSGSTRSLTDAASEKRPHLVDNPWKGPVTLEDTQSSQSSVLNPQSSLEKIFWNENFLLGPYTATLNLALSEKGPIYNKSIVFLAVPLEIIIGIILSLLIAITVFLRVRYRLKSDR